MNLSRKKKNYILTSALWALVLVKFILHFLDAPTLSLFDWFFIGLVLLVTLLNYSPLRSLFSPRLLHVGLFLTMGTGIGTMLGSALRNPQSLHYLEWGWMAIGITAALLHYSNSDQDEYIN